MTINVDPRVDIVFKKLFGSPDHPALTKSFVNALLEAAGLPAAVELTIQNPFILAEFEGGKDCELDILYRDEAGRDVQLEMQVSTHSGLSQRMVHNWTQLYYRQLGKGQEYYEHRPVISIWILDESLFKDGEWFHVFRFHCPATGTVLHGDACIMTVELPVWSDLNQCSGQDILKSIEKWNFFLTRARGQEDEPFVSIFRDPVFKEAVEIMVNFTRSEKMRHAYDMRQNYPGIIASYKRTGYEQGMAEGKAAGMVAGIAEGKAEGIAEGIAEGKAEGKAEGINEGKVAALRETARRMKARNLPIDDIVDITGLPREEIATL